MFCSKCGKEVSANDLYCKNCGSPIGKKEEPQFIGEMSKKEYKKMYLFYGVAVAVLLWGFLYVRIIRLVDVYGGYGMERVLEKFFGQFWGISICIIGYCVSSMIKGKMKILVWKIGRMILSIIISLVMGVLLLFNIARDLPVMTGLEAFEWMQGTIPFVIIIMVIIFAVLFLRGCFLSKVENINIWHDKNYEVVSSVLAADVWVTMATVVMYVMYYNS